MKVPPRRAARLRYSIAAHRAVNTPTKPLTGVAVQKAASFLPLRRRVDSPNQSRSGSMACSVVRFRLRRTS